MYYLLTKKLAVTSGAGNEKYTQPVEMTDANSGQVDFTVYESSASDAITTIQVQESNDLQNWTNVTDFSGTVTNEGYKSFYGASGPIKVAARYIRLKASVDNGTAIVSSGVHLVKA